MMCLLKQILNRIVEGVSLAIVLSLFGALAHTGCLKFCNAMRDILDHNTQNIRAMYIFNPLLAYVALVGAKYRFYRYYVNVYGQMIIYVDSRGGTDKAHPIATYKITFSDACGRLWKVRKQASSISSFNKKIRDMPPAEKPWED